MIRKRGSLGPVGARGHSMTAFVTAEEKQFNLMIAKLLGLNELPALLSPHPDFYETPQMMVRIKEASKDGSQTWLRAEWVPLSCLLGLYWRSKTLKRR